MAPSFALLVFFSLATVLTLSTSTTFPGDIDALKSIKKAVDPSSIPPGSCLASWDFAADPCDSSFTDRFTCGLRCDTQTTTNISRVTEIALDSAGYSGPISPSLTSLPFLQTLDLADNRFSGPFPSPSLPLLRRLSLSRNLFSAQFPNLSSAPSLQEAYFDNNFFSGTLNLGDLKSLHRLEIQNNNLTGQIPDLAALSSLSYFDASANAFVGGFPSQLPYSLLEISLRDNRLTGEIPGPRIAGLPMLQVMDLSHNGLSGGVPREVFEHPALEQLNLGYNGFGWIEEPRDGGAGSGLVAVEMGHNRIRGLLPAFFGSMPRLSAVGLEDNGFNGMIPVQYAVRAVGGEPGMAPFARLLLAGNYLFGPIPGPMGAMKEGSAVVSLADNCLFRCPPVFFFCLDGQQKPPSTCRDFNPVIP